MLTILKHSTWNIGDDIQRLGLMSVLPENVILIDREDRTALEALTREDKLIVSGWFERGRHYWYGNIQAQMLYAGFYIDVPMRVNGMVGCRDLYTYREYAAKGFGAYPSWCTSLLHKRREGARRGVVLCDVSGEDEGRIPEMFVQNCTRVTHHVAPNADRNAEVERLLGIYASAELVITSRLHAILPCLAMGVPVVFTSATFQPNRFTGYEGLFWTLDDVTWQCSAPSTEHPWVHIPARVTPEYVRGLTKGLTEVIMNFIHV